MSQVGGIAGSASEGVGVAGFGIGGVGGGGLFCNFNRSCHCFYLFYWRIRPELPEQGQRPPCATGRKRHPRPPWKLADFVCGRQCRVVGHDSHYAARDWSSHLTDNPVMGTLGSVFHTCGSNSRRRSRRFATSTVGAMMIVTLR